MNPEKNRRQCIVCGESEPSFIHTVSKNGVSRRLCTDCLLKEHQELFCPICLNVFDDDDNEVPPPKARIICVNCPSITHLSCSPPSSSSAAFACPPCADPNFTFFPKSHVQGKDVDGSEAPLNMESVKALVAAAQIAVVSMKKVAAQLKKDSVTKIVEAKMAKLRAKKALANLQDLVIEQQQKAASEKNNNNNPNKRKNSDR